MPSSCGKTLLDGTCRWQERASHRVCDGTQCGAGSDVGHIPLTLSHIQIVHGNSSQIASQIPAIMATVYWIMVSYWWLTIDHASHGWFTIATTQYFCSMITTYKPPINHLNGVDCLFFRRFWTPGKPSRMRRRRFDERVSLSCHGSWWF